MFDLNLQKDWQDVHRVYCVLYGPQKGGVPKRLTYYPDKEAFLSGVGTCSCFYEETVTKVEKGGVDRKLGFTLTYASKFYCFLGEDKSERDIWMTDVKGMVTAAKKASERSHGERISYPIPNTEADSYTEGILIVDSIYLQSFQSKTTLHVLFLLISLTH